MQLCGTLSIHWDCLSLVLEWKLTFSCPVATAEFSKFAGILSAALSQHHIIELLKQPPTSWFPSFISFTSSLLSKSSSLKHMWYCLSCLKLSDSSLPIGKILYTIHIMRRVLICPNLCLPSMIINGMFFTLFTVPVRMIIQSLFCFFFQKNERFSSLSCS